MNIHTTLAGTILLMAIASTSRGDAPASVPSVAPVRANTTESDAPPMIGAGKTFTWQPPVMTPITEVSKPRGERSRRRQVWPRRGTLSTSVPALIGNVFFLPTLEVLASQSHFSRIKTKSQSSAAPKLPTVVGSHTTTRYTKKPLSCR